MKTDNEKTGCLRAFLNDRRGGVLPLFGISIFVFIGAAGLAVDVSSFYMLQGKLQATADAAALSATSQLPDENAARTTALEYAGKNMASAQHGTVVANSVVSQGWWKIGELA